MRSKVLIIKKIIKIAIIVILFFNFLITLSFSIINPEAYFFGSKLSGMDAIIYLVTNGMIGIFIVYLLLIRERSGVYLVGLFFGYNLIEILVTNIVSFHFYGLSPLFLLGLALTTYLIIKERSRSKSR